MKKKRLKSILLSVSLAVGLGLTYGLATAYGDAEKKFEATAKPSTEGAEMLENYSSKNCKDSDKYNKSSKCCPKSAKKSKE